MNSQDDADSRPDPDEVETPPAEETGEFVPDGERSIWEDHQDTSLQGWRLADGTPLLPASRQPDDISPPGSIARAANHLAFYVVAMSLLPALLWYAYGRVVPESKIVFFWPAIITSCFGVLVVVLRVLRGSVRDARRELREQLRWDQENGIDPSNRLARQMFSDQDSTEKIMWESRAHPISLLFGGIGRLRSKWWRWTVGASLILIWFLAAQHAAWLWLLAVTAGCYAGLLLLEWSRNTYAITDHRIVSVTGLVDTKAALMPLLRVTDVVVNISALSNILAWMRFIYLPYAQFDVESAGQDQALKYINYVPAGEDIASVFGLGKIPR